MVSAWELQKAFYDDQATRAIPLDEDFDPVFVFHSGDTVEERHPHWVALKPRLEIKKLYEQGRICSRGTSGVRFTDEVGTYRGLEWIGVPDGQVVYTRTAMRGQQFPLYIGELFSELMTVLLFDRLQQYLETGKGAVSPKEVEAMLHRYSERYSMGGLHSCGQSYVSAAFSWHPQEQRMVLTTPERSSVVATSRPRERDHGSAG